jgi:hypothetical protein
MTAYGRYNSSDTPDLAEGIARSKTNPITIAALSGKVVYGGVEVVSPSSILDDFMEHIMSEAVDMALPEAFWYRPEALAETLYGTPDLFHLVMAMNGVGTVTEFRMDSVKVLAPGSKILDNIVTVFMKKLNDRRANPQVIEDLTVREIV